MELTARYRLGKGFARKLAFSLAPVMAYVVFLVVARGYPPYFILEIVGIGALLLYWAIGRRGRPPWVIVGPAGIRFPVLALELAWAEVAEIRLATAAESRSPKLLVVPVDPGAVLARVKSAYRHIVAPDMARFGTPLVLRDVLDRSLEEITSAVAENRPRV